jgi:hypothetical protein
MTFDINLNVRSHGTVTGESNCTLKTKVSKNANEKHENLTIKDILKYYNNCKK